MFRCVRKFGLALSQAFFQVQLTPVRTPFTPVPSQSKLPIMIPTASFTIGFKINSIHVAQIESRLSFNMNQSVTAKKHKPCSPVKIFVDKET